MSEKSKQAPYGRLKKAIIFGLAATMLTAALVAAPFTSVFASPAKASHSIYETLPRIPNSYIELGSGSIQALKHLGNPLPVRSAEFSDPRAPDHLIWYAQEAKSKEEFYIEGIFDKGRLDDLFRITAHDPDQDMDYVCVLKIMNDGKIILHNGRAVMEDTVFALDIEDSLIEKSKGRLCGFLDHIKKGVLPQKNRVEYIDIPSNPLLNPFFDGTRYARLVTMDKQSKSPRVTFYAVKGDIFFMQTRTRGEPLFGISGSFKEPQKLSKDIKDFKEALLGEPQWTAYFNTSWLDQKKYTLTQPERNVLEYLFPESENKKPLEEKDIPPDRREAYRKLKAAHDKAKNDMAETIIQEVKKFLEQTPILAKDNGQSPQDYLKVNGPKRKKTGKRHYIKEGYRDAEEPTTNPQLAQPPTPTPDPTRPSKVPSSSEDPIKRYQRLMLQHNR